MTSTITLTGNIALSSAAAFQSVTKPIIINTGVYTLTGVTGSGVNGSGGSIAIPGGPITIKGSVKGGNAAASDSRGTGGAGIVKGDSSVRNDGTVYGGTGGNATRSGSAGKSGGQGGAGAALIDSTLVNSASGRFIGGAGGSYDAENLSGSGPGGTAGVGGAGVTMMGGALDNEGVIIGGTGGSVARLPASGRDNLLGGAGGIGAVLDGGAHVNSGTIMGGQGGTGVNAEQSGHGAAGMGISLSNGSLLNSGTIVAANGRAGGSDLPGSGSHGAAGAKVANGTLENHGTIAGGNSGRPSGGGGGAAVSGEGGATIITGGALNAGVNGDGTRASSVVLSNGGNTLELHSGYSFKGEVIAGQQDTFALGGRISDSFLVSDLGDDRQFQGFGYFEKRGTSTWSLNGTTEEVTSWAILGGVLQISNDANLGAAGGRLTLDGGTLQNTAAITSVRDVTVGMGGGAFLVDTDLTLSGVIGGTGTLAKVGNGRLTLTGDSLAFAGDTSLQTGTLAVNGSLCGHMDVFPGARLEGIGTVCDTTNAGTIAPGNSIGRLTIDGDYLGNDGMLEIEAELGGDNSPTDLLIVTGDTSGNTNVRLINVGGVGALTTDDGIKIIDVGGVSDGAFTLLGDYVYRDSEVMVLGAYAYGLHQHGISTPADGDWYLRSSFQAGVPIYESYAGVLQSFNALGTLQQRVGNRSWTTVPPVVEKGMPSQYGLIEGYGLWTRLETAGGSFTPPTSTSGAEHDLTTWELQTGADLLLTDHIEGSLIGGLAFHYGTFSSDITSIYGVGTIEGTGYGLGATLTWFGYNGLYVDSQAAVTRYDSDLHSNTAGRALARGKDALGYGVSFEAGQVLALSPNWSVTPQGQLAYSAVDMDGFVDPFGVQISFDESYTFTGRIGAALDRQVEWRSSAGTTSRSHLYGIANIYYDFSDSSAADVAGTKVESEDEALWGGLGLGASLNLADDRYSIYGQAVAKTSLENFGDSHSLSGTIGLRIGW